MSPLYLYRSEATEDSSTCCSASSTSVPTNISIPQQQYSTFNYGDHFGPYHEQSAIEVHYTQALCMALGKNNGHTKEQSSWLKGFLVTKAVPSVLIESVDALLEQAGELCEEEFLDDCELLKPTFQGPVAMSVIYDMLQGACVSGFVASQWEAITMLATGWNVSLATLQEMRTAVTEEEQVRRQRLQKLFPKLRNIDHMLMMPRIETHMYLVRRQNHRRSAAQQVPAGLSQRTYV